MDFKKILTAFSLFILCLFSTYTVHAFGGLITSPFGYRTHPIFGTVIYHSGIDIGVVSGTAVPAADSGTVIYSGWAGGYGYFVMIDHGDGIVSCYGHNEELLVQEGDKVSKGDVISLSGSTGYSTGPHLHFEVRQDGEPIDPTSFAKRAGWDLTGDTSTNIIIEIGKHIKGAITPNIDVDFTNYFVPSETIAETTKRLITLISKCFDFAEKNLLSLLVGLMIIDLAWYFIRGIIATGFGLSGSESNIENFGTLIPRFIRYGFFIALFRSWHTLVATFFIPMAENISSTYSGHEITQSSFIKFDDLFISVSHVLAPFLHVDERFPLVVGCIVGFFVFLCLCFTILSTIFLAEKLISFYIMLVFGVLGIPLMFIPRMGQYGKNMISSILSCVFDLIVTMFAFTFISDHLADMTPLDEKSIASLVIFTGVLGLILYLIPALTKRTHSAFASLWS